MSNVVRIDTFNENIENASALLKNGWGVLLQGQGSSGKTLVANELARTHGVVMKTINVDDTFDSKDLLGKFSATDVPGVFEWIAGPVTEAVTNGQWLLMEDIDLASFDVFSVLLPLITSGTLFLADKGKTIAAHPSFRLIATQQLMELGTSNVLSTKKMNSIPNIESWSTVIVKVPTTEEKLAIVSTLYPSVPLEPLTQLLQQIPVRYCGLRDVLKWSQRVFKQVDSNKQGGFLSSTVRELLFQEAYDCFCASFPLTAERDALISSLANCCGVPVPVAHSMINERKPQLNVTREVLQIGRVSLPMAGPTRKRDAVVAFAETKQSMTLMERLACSAGNQEPVLLTGETGVGKTFLVQYLADNLGQSLIVHNLNQQTDSSDFMGGWKPRDMSQQIRVLYNKFIPLFKASFNWQKNVGFLDSIASAVEHRSLDAALVQFEKGCRAARSTLTDEDKSELLEQWNAFAAELTDVQGIVQAAKTSFLFVFEEGTLVKAWREGHWILLDEVNLASTEVLERVASVLGGSDTLIVTERGSTEEVPRHPNFRVFANMNPPTDVGKKDLPPSLRSRFTEFYVPDPFDRHDLTIVVGTYLAGLSPDAKVNEIVNFFLECVASARSALCDLDGESKPPHFSLRSLTRALTYIRRATSMYGFNTSILDGLMMSFASPLQRKFHTTIHEMIVRIVFHGRAPGMATLPKQPPGADPSKKFIPYEHIWLELGPLDPFVNERFILTHTVKDHLKNIARAVFTKRPVLLEGPTSAGKSSMVQYLAELTGHQFVRINNHESTEIQEYLGHYVSDENGKLRFVDGCLTAAVRHGHWVVLDELNLAPTEVLEALNRLLDDNCELFVPDTQETIQPHPNLRIFATQNPSGIYGGRKALSRAFRNRFLEIIVDDIPTKEIQEILCKRYSMPPKFAEKMVEVMTMLQIRRQSSHLFAGRHGYITPRDLFRWADRHAMDYQTLADHGYLLLGERCRKPDEKRVVKDVIEKCMKVIIEDNIYDPNHWEFTAKYFKLVDDVIKEKIVWTPSMQRLFTIVGLCLEHKEPVLLVGETGSSKTTICQIWATVLNQTLQIVNCHQHSEASDFLGSLRPTPQDQANDSLFAWQDGPLVRSMRRGDIFVLDEISLAEDSVLERLNSVLEPSRTLTLAEKSTGELLTADEAFRFLATMNPGGDFGKKELSPALRNRFTEVYVQPITNQAEIAQIICKRLPDTLHMYASHMARLLLAVAERKMDSVIHISIRDVIGWADFMFVTHERCDPDIAFWHGLDAILLDGLSVGGGVSEASVETIRSTCLTVARSLVPKAADTLQEPFWSLCTGTSEPKMPVGQEKRFFFGAPTTRKNASKLVRASVLKKAVMLEGSPGVGKTSIVEALGAAFEKVVVRINLSEQTDMMDLLGAFLPCASSAEGPTFEWSDGILLNAVKSGHWVILDELNLASQSVLEGLNALLDHRSTIFLPELCKEVTAHPDFRLFACQNPLVEGGGRKGLPKSFLNRFTKVRVASFTFDDLMCIAMACTDMAEELVNKMVTFVCKLQEATMETRSFGSRGSPWEFNLRDVLRWSKLMLAAKTENPRRFADMLFFQRFRTAEDQQSAVATYNSVFGEASGALEFVNFRIKNNFICGENLPIMSAVHDTTVSSPLLLAVQTTILNSVLWCAASNQFCVLIGPAASGKSSILSLAARMVGATLDVFSMTAGCDTMDLLGGFDQVEGRQGSFEWRDSVILKAMIEGHWVVLDNANFCSASVLDRLNSLVEPNGVLVVNEQGLVDGEVRVVRPHPNFRLFATMDPKFGEMSRALRNRSVELFVAPPPIPSQDACVLSYNTEPEAQQGLIDNINAFHQYFVQSTAFADTRKPMEGRLSDALAAGAPTLVTLLRALKLSSGVDNAAQALFSSYIRNRSGVWSVHREKIELFLREINFESVTSAIAKDGLVNASRLRDGSLQSALLVAAAFRAALIFFYLKHSDQPASEATWDGALMHFVMHSSVSGDLSVSILNELNSMGVPLSNTFEIKQLLERADSPANVVVLSDVTVGRSARALQLPCHSSVPSNVSESIDELFRSVTGQFDSCVITPTTALKLLAYIRPILCAFHGKELTPTTKAMLPLLTYVTLVLRCVTESGDDAHLRQSAMAAFSALRRYANLAGDMAPPPLLLLTGQPTANDTSALAALTEQERLAEEFHLKRSNAENSLYPLWRQAAARQEVNIMAMLTKCLLSDHKRALVPLLQSFDVAFTGKVPLLLKGIMAGVGSDLSLSSVDRLAGISDLISKSSFRKGEAASALVPGSWIGSACRSLRLANAATLGDFCDFSRSTTSQVLTLLRASLEPSVLSPMDSSAKIREWLHCEVEWLLRVLEGENHVEPSPPLEQLLKRTLAVTHEKKLSSFQHKIADAISILHDDAADFVTLLKGCILFNIVKCHLLTPSSFVDPMLSYQLGKLASQEEVAYWSEVLGTAQTADSVSFGLTRPSELTSTLREVTKHFVEQDSLMQQKYTPRPDETGVRFVELVTTQNELCNGILADERLSVCLRFLDDHISVGSPSKRSRTERPPVSREEVESWCQLMRTSANEMYHRFKGYEDFILPFSQSLTMIAFFAETALVAIPSGVQSYLQGEEAASLIEFPCPKPVLIHPPLDINEKFGDLSKLLDSTLKETRVQASTGVCNPTPIFESLSHVYAAVEELNRSELHQDELAVMYKEKAIVIEGDDERNIRRLKEMFPEYEKEFDDLDKDENEGEDEEADAEARTKKMGRTARLLFNGDNGQRLRQIPAIHRDIYNLLSLAKVSTESSNGRMESFESRFDAVASLQRGVFACHSSDELKTISGCLARAKLLQQKITEARPVAAVDIEKMIESSFNIYLDCVPSESAMVAKCLNDLSMSVQKLVFEYPDNITLSRIMKIIRRLQEYPAFSTPLMRIVTATEVLLRESYEWERNASREVSILHHINALSGCVLRWRRMELHCWPHVFVAKENEFVSRASAKWFELFRFCKQVSSRTAEFDVNAVFSYASDFMWNCCIGEYETRLSLLEAFGTQLIQDNTHDDAITCGTVFLHISGFFTQFRQLVQSTIANVKAPLQEDIEEFCRIMRWEDATYYAVRSSTQKSHSKISRVLISLEEGLRQPLLQVITKSEDESFEQNMGFTMATAPVVKIDKTKKADKEKDAKAKKAAKRTRKGKATAEEEEEPQEDPVTRMHKSRWSCGDLFIAGEYLDDTRETIVERIMALQAPKVPQNQKSRALKLLFESTEEAGIPQTHEASLPDWHILYSAGSLPPNILTERKLARSFGDTSKAADLRVHFYKLSRVVQKMRDCQRTPHTDITVGQVNRGTGMAETLFADVAFLNRGLSELTIVKDGLFSLQMAVDKSAPSSNPIYRNSISLIRQSRSVAMWMLAFVSQSDWLEGGADLQAVGTSAKELLEFADRYFYPVSRAGYELSQVEYTALQKHLLKCEADLSPIASQPSGIGSQAAGFVRDLRKIRATPTKIPNEPETAWKEKVTELMNDLEQLFQALPPSSPIVETKKSEGEGEDEEFPTAVPVVQHGRDAYATVLLNITTAKSALQQFITQTNSSRTLSVSDQNKLAALVSKQISVVDSMAFFLHQWTERLSHFSMVIAKVMIALMKKGFCKSEDEEEDDQQGDGDAGESKEGTGMDDGKGEKDVTDELENEDQLMNMKDKEQQENDDDEGDGEDKDKAAEVETDFQADKEDRSDDEEDEDDDDSDAEMGSVDEENQQERKKSRKEKDDPEMNEDEGGAAEEVPEDDLAQDKEKNEGDDEDGEDETKDYGNKEKEIRDADSDADKNSDEAELLGDNESQQFSDDEDDDSAKSADDEKDAQDSDADDKSVASEVDEDGEGDGADEERQGSDEDSDEDPDRQEEAEMENPNAADNGDAQSTDDDDDDNDEANEMSKVKDQNSQYTGEQDDEAGEEENADQEKKTQKHEDAEGAENEEQTGNEQEKNDAGRSWKKKDQNEQSQKSSSDQKKQTNDANPMKALKEAMKRHTQKAKQLNLDRQVKLNEDNTDDNTRPDDDAVEEDDDFEIHEKGMDEGMAPTDDVNPSAADATLPDQADTKSDEEEGDDAEPSDAPQDTKARRKKENDETEIEETESKEKDSKKDKKKNRKIKLTAKEDEEEEEDENTPEDEPQAEALDEKAQRGRDLWYETEAVVAGHAQNLCEQLRLILAPTQADKLQGDYKTGKRINIKKIIPYIASQFKKDRIWLRRTKPNKRSYQVLIALDDSLSMLKNNAGVVSCQAVALLSKAMQQLEVGEFGILRFGKDTAVVHPLAEAFAADSGPRAFAEFTFEQQSTSMKTLLETSLDYMDMEKSRLGGSIRSTTQTLRQMLFVVSDGQITEDRAALRKLLARAEENGQAVVLLILDIAAYDPNASDTAASPVSSPTVASPTTPGSDKGMSLAEKMRRHNAARDARLQKSLKGVLDMQVVEFQGTKVIKKAYLEDFPFPFYIVVQDIPSLPTMLADAMRQWFELLASGQ